MKISPHIKAIIFDYDGVLGDSDKFNTYACRESAKRCGIDLEESIYRHCAPGGATIHDIASCIVSHYGKPEMVDEYIEYKRSFDVDYVKEVEILPSVQEVVSELFRSYPLAVNTGTRHILVDSFLAKYQLNQYIQVTIAAEDISIGKPDPESYLLTCKLLNINPKNCLVVEDGKSGIISAKKAGCYVVGITNSLSENDLIGLGCNQVIKSLTELIHT